MKRIKLFALLIVLAFIASCDGKPSAPKAPDPMEKAFNETWATYSPYLGYLLGIVVILYIAKLIIEIFFPGLFSKDKD